MAEIAFVARLLVGLIFLCSAAGKLRKPELFVRGVLEYSVLPKRLARLYGSVVPPSELMLGIALVAGVAPQVSAIAGASLLATFLFGVVVNLVRGRRIECHCFGSGLRHPVDGATAARLVILLGCSAVTAVYSGGARLGLSPLPDVALPASLIAVGLALALRLSAEIRSSLAVWSIPVVRVERRTGGRISLRQQPLDFQIGQWARADARAHQSMPR